MPARNVKCPAGASLHWRSRHEVLVCYHPANGRISSPGDEGGASAAEPRLIKFPASQEHRDVCAVEALYARLAVHCSLDMPPSKFFGLDGRYSAFGVRRFDREARLRKVQEEDRYRVAKRRLAAGWAQMGKPVRHANIAQ